MNRRDLLRLGVATGMVVPAEKFVRRFFPVGIALKRPRMDGFIPPSREMVNGWLDVQMVDGRIIATCDPEGLAEGTYTATITVADPCASDFSVDVPVHFSVQGLSRDFPLMGVSPSVYQATVHHGPSRGMPYIAGVRYS